MRGLKRFIDIVIIPISQRVSPLRKLVSYVSTSIDQHGYNYLKKQFIQNGERPKWDKTVRSTIVERYETIDRKVPIGTTPTDGLFLAEALLSLQTEGAIIECGCYAGGTTAKLSIVAKLLGKKLFVYDSFEGLPKVDEYNMRDYHARRSSEWVTDWTAGRYAARLDQVKSNIEKYGEISPCIFREGWFSETLKEENLPQRVCFAFTDVDIASSAKVCLRAIWPLISVNGVYFSHDVAYIKVLQAILDEKVWRDVLKEFPPILFGAGYGLGDSSSHLGFMVKGQSVTAEYVKSLAIQK